MPFRAALSGIQASGKDLRMIGNNIANASTTGFKKSRAEFADVYAASAVGTAANAVGAGVRLAAVRQQFSQGNIDFTDNALDLAINGRGFFIVEDNGERLYTRAGAFEVDREGYIVNSSNQRLVVNQTDDLGAATGDVGPLKINTSNINPSATTAVDVGLNLDSTQEKPVVGPFDPEVPESYNHSTSLTVYDSLGSPHLATLYYVKTDIPNQWETYVFVDGKDIRGGAAAPYTANLLQFDGSGSLAAIDGVPSPPGRITYPGFDTGTGSDPLVLTLDYASNTPTTQFGSNFNVNALTQNGYTTGRLTALDIDEAGVVRARFTNGQTRTLGQLALADFPNAQGLRQLGDTTWAESFESGIPLVGVPGSGSLGLVQSGALEGSNVDLTEQLVNMITAQRNFQANAQVISTADTVTQTIINIR
ncbi:MAG TPA: flagellar hook protein FlgE [Gammaproteobacteria bacterium]|nr:flagellar hook protein FlgE [Gammaproteobacteria bacterium]